MTLTAFIDAVLAGLTGQATYDAYEATSKAAANGRGQVLDARVNSVLDVVKRDILSPWGPGTLTDGGRQILQALRTR